MLSPLKMKQAKIKSLLNVTSCRGNSTIQRILTSSGKFSLHLKKNLSASTYIMSGQKLITGCSRMDQSISEPPKTHPSPHLLKELLMMQCRGRNNSDSTY